MSKIVAITIGDYNGIGIHILLESWKNEIKNFILFSNIDKISKILKNKNLQKCQSVKNINNITVKVKYLFI